MATFNATSSVQTLGNGSNNTGNDTFNIPSGSVQAGDVFNGGTGTDTLSMGNNITINFSVSTITSMERLQFGNGGSATFNANQFGGSLISNSLTVLGAGGSQAIVINNASNFSAASWTFSGWTSGTDTITINGTSGNDTITAGTGADTINVGGGDDTINIANGQFVAGESINGGGGIDSIVLTNATTVDFSSGTITSVGRLTGSSSNDAVIMSGLQWAGFSTAINLGGGANDTLSVVASGDISALGIPSAISNIETGNLIGTAGTDTITLTGAQLNAIIIGSGTINLGLGLGDTINLTSTSADLNSLGATNASIQGVEAISAATAAAGVTVNLGGQSEDFAITGSGQADTITGGSGADTINGGGGADTINGGGGADIINGAGGADIINGGGGADNISGGGGVDTINGGGAADTITGGAGADSLTGGGGVDTYVWNTGDGNDTITLTGAANEDVILINGTFYDFNVEVAGNDLLVGVAANENYDWNDVGGNLRIQDFFVGGDSIAYVEADLGPGPNAFYSPDGGIARIYFSAINGTNQGNYFEYIAGTSGNDVMTDAGGVGHDRFVGGAGNDIIAAGTGDDTLVGGDDADTYVWNASDGYDTINAAGAANEDVIQINGTFYDYYFEVDGNDLLVGVAADENYDWNDVGGNLRIQNFFVGGDSIAYLEADLGPDNNAFYSPDEVNSHIYFSALNGTDQGNNWEVIAGTELADVMTDSAGVGTNRFIGLGGDDTMSISDGIAATFIGGTGADTMTGADQDDTFRGGSGGDTMNGMGGVDLVRYDRPDGSGDQLHGAFVNLSTSAVTYDFGGETNVTVQAGEAIDGWVETAMFTDIEATDKLSNIENVRGSNFADVIVGSADANFIEGLNGNDIIEGGGGSDYLRGGGEADSFVFGTEIGDAVIEDFEVGMDFLRFKDSAGIATLSLIDTDDDTFDDATLVTLTTGATVTLLGITDIAVGSAIAEPLDGTSGADIVFGDGGADTITGGAGNDYLMGGEGVDTYVWNAGDGFDTVLAVDAANEDVIQINGTFYDYSWEIDGNDLLIGVAADENYDWNDVGGNLRIQDFFVGGDSIAYMEADLGQANQNYYPYDTSSPRRAYLSAVNGTDQGDYYEIIIGTSGNDMMTGGGGAEDFLWGDDGEDTLSVADGTRGIFRGGNDNDTITGADQNDIIRGGAGDDTMDGGAGAGDVVGYDVRGGSAVITQGSFVNLSAGSITFDFNGMPSVTVLAGQAIDNWGDTDTLSNIENVRGSNFADVIVGSSDENVIEGLAGNDIIAGGVGNDYLVGGADSDTFVFDAIDMGYVDTIGDFEIGVDSLQLDGGLAISLIENYDSDGDFTDDSTLVTLDNTSTIVLLNVLDVADEGNLFV